MSNKFLLITKKSNSALKQAFENEDQEKHQNKNEGENETAPVMNLVHRFVFAIAPN
jgi:hypothetical protein